jgi:4-aminobutyrate aminotransferase-like enzyme
MAAAHAVFQTIEREGLVQHAAQLGEHAMSRLRASAARLPLIKQVRGRGLFIGVELHAREAPALNATEVVRRCRDRGLLINATQDVVLRIAPAINISRREIDQGLDILESVLAG